jgi:CcmD family protein
MAAGAVLGAAPRVSAQEGSGAVAAPYRAEVLSEEGFRPADQTRPGDQVAGAPLMVAAYAVIWALVLGYVVHLTRRQQAVARELRELADRLAVRDPA